MKKLLLILLLPLMLQAQITKLKLSADSLYLTDQSGVPVFLNGEAAWCLFTAVTTPQATQYLASCQEKGINYLEVCLIQDAWIPNAPRNAYGQLPFTGAAFSTPNEAYFAHVDSILTIAAGYGIYIDLFTNYLGSNSTEGWQTEISASSSAVMLGWGQYVGNRYGSRPNITWCMSGDCDPSTWQAKVDQVVAGIRQYDTASLMNTRDEPYTFSTTHWPNRTWITLQGYYPYWDTWDIAQLQTMAKQSRWRVGGRRLPGLLKEAWYEDEHSPNTTPVQLRSQMYMSILNGGLAGQVFGNCTMYSFGKRTDSPFCGTGNFVNYLESAGRISNKWAGKLFRSRNWYKFIPDTNHTVMTAGYGTSGASYVTTSYASDGSTIVAYIPTSRTVTVTSAGLVGDSTHAWWFNPATGATTDLGMQTRASHTYTPPAGDYVLVLDAKSMGYTAPGTPAVQAPQKWVTGHVPWWDLAVQGQNDGSMTGLDYTALTHVIMFAGGFTSGGGVDSTGGGNVTAAMRGPYNNYIHTTYPGKAVLFCMFSRTGETMSGVIGGSSNDAMRKTVASNIKKFLIADKYDGVDFDFEPISTSDFTNAALFIKLLYDTLQTMQAFYDPTKKPIIACDAMTPDFWNRSDVYPYVDQINLMRYDRNGSWLGQIWFDCCVYGLESMATGVTWMLQSGIPRAKIGMGFSTNGYEFINGVNTSGSNILSAGDATSVYPTRTSSEIWYHDIQKNWIPGAVVHQHPTAKASWISVANNYKNFTDTISAAYAVQMVKDSSIGGLMVWTASAQYLTPAEFPSATNRNPILSAIKAAQINGSVGAATKYIVSSSSYNPIAGTTVTISAQLSDASNLPVSTSGKVVTWSKTGSGGSFASATSTTNTSGTATVVFTTSSTAGIVYAITGTDNTSLTGVGSNITTITPPPVPTTIEITSGNNQSQTINTTLNPFVVTVKDQYGNPYAGTAVTWSVYSAPAGSSPAAGTLAMVPGQNTGGRAATITFPLSVTAGNTILVATTVYNPATIPTISKSSGTATIGAFTQDGDLNTPFGTTARMNIFRATVTGSGTLTLGISPTTYWGWYWAINEYSGFAVSPLDGAQVSNQSTSSTYTTGSVTLSAPGMIFAHYGDYTGTAFTYPTNSDFLIYKAENWLQGTGLTQHKIAGAGTYTLTVGASGSFAYGALARRYIAASATGGYSLSNSTSTTNSSGVANTFLTLAPQAGTYVIRATASGLVGSPLSFTATATSGTSPATKYIVTSNNSSPVAGGTVTITAQLADSSNNPVNTAGKIVTWSKTGTGGSFGSPTSTTNASGIATVTFTVGTTAGTVHTVTGTDNDVLTGTSGNITVTNTTASKYLVTSSSYGPVAGAGVTITAQLADQYNNSVATASKTVTWSKTGTGGSFASATSTTNSSGIATVVFTTNTTTGTVHTVTGTDNTSLTGVTSSITTITGVASKYLVTSSGYSPVGGTAVTITAQLTDANNNVVATAGKTVTWSKTGTGGSFANPTSVTNSSGIATIAFTTNTTVGTIHTVTGTDNTALTGVTSNITTVSGTATKFIVTANTYSPATGSSVILSAQLADASDNPIATPGISVSWYQSGNNIGTFTTPTLTNASGIATTTVTITGLAGTSASNQAIDMVNSPYPQGQTSAITVVAGAASQVRVENLANGSGTVLVAQNVGYHNTLTGYAISRDAYGNFVANVAAIWALINRTGGVVAGDLVPSGDTKSAIFTGNAAGTAQIQPTSGVLTKVSSGTLTVLASPATKIIVETLANGTGQTQPDAIITGGASITVYAVTRDASNNFVANAVSTWALTNKTGGVVDGDLVASGDGKSAAFTAHIAGTAKIEATNGALTKTSSGTITVLSGVYYLIRK